MWLFIAKVSLSNKEHENWLFKGRYLDYNNHQLYALALYWSVTTITTVGYGDIGPDNAAERIYCILVMMIGVFLYSYTIGALSNLLTNLDRRKAKLNRKLEILMELTHQYKLSR
jgi:voltage-gated potassium channel